MRKRRNGHTSAVTTAELERIAEELGIDAVGAAPAAAYDETERHIRERRERGLFADMRFTMARPEVSCHPETLLPDARTVVSAALCYYAPAPPPGQGEGRLPRYTWHDAYAELRERLDALGRRLGGAYRVLVDANQHVDREGAVRAGIGFYGKNTMLITRRHGSWVVLGTLVTDVEIEPSAAARARLRRVPPLHRRVPHRRARRARHARRHALPLVLDAGGRADPGGLPRAARRHGLRLRHLPGRLPVEPGDREAPRRTPTPGGAVVSLADWLCDADDLADRYDRLYVPRNDPRYLRRNALVALGNTGGRPRSSREPYAEGDDPLLREHAEWALARLEGSAVVNYDQRVQARALARVGPAGSGSVRRLPGAGHHRLPAGREALGLATVGVLAVGAVAPLGPVAAPTCSRRSSQSWASPRSPSTSRSSRRSSSRCTSSARPRSGRS